MAELQAGGQTSPFDHWDAVTKEIGRQIADSLDPFDAATIANVEDLVTLCRAQCPVPEGTKRGYWSTISIWWHRFEIEVFGDHYELYHFSDGDTEIQHVEHRPGEQFPADFLDQLPKLEASQD